MGPAFALSGLRLQIGRKSPSDPLVEGIEDRRLDQKNQFALEMDHMAMCVQENKTHTRRAKNVVRSTV